MASDISTRLRQVEQRVAVLDERYAVITDGLKEINRKLDNHITHISGDVNKMENNLTKIESAVVGLQEGLKQAARQATVGVSSSGSGIFNRDKLIEMSLRAVTWALAITAAAFGLKLTQ